MVNSGSESDRESNSLTGEGWWWWWRGGGVLGEARGLGGASREGRLKRAIEGA